MRIVILYGTHQPSTILCALSSCGQVFIVRFNDPTESDVLRGEIRKCPSSPCRSRSYRLLSEKRVLRIARDLYFFSPRCHPSFKETTPASQLAT